MRRTIVLVVLSESVLEIFDSSGISWSYSSSSDKSSFSSESFKSSTISLGRAAFN